MNPLYRFFKDNNLTQKSEQEFEETLRSAEGNAKIYNFLKENNLTEKTAEQFASEYGRPKSEREKLGMSREEYGKHVQSQTAEEIQNQRLKATVEENPTLSAMFPRTAESIAGGNYGFGSAILDEASFPFRTMAGSAEALAAETVGEDLSGMGAFMGGLSRTGEEGPGMSTSDYVQSEFSPYENLQMSPVEANELRQGEGLLAQIGRGAVTDPVNAIPFGTIAKPIIQSAKGAKVLSKFFPAAEEVVEQAAKLPVDPAASTLGRKLGTQGMQEGIPKMLKNLPYQMEIKYICSDKDVWQTWCFPRGTLQK